MFRWGQTDRKNLVDIGLLTCVYLAETKIELISQNGEVNNGAHFENVVAQQLLANGFEPYKPRDFVKKFILIFVFF